jgi:hypothetical protein
VRPPALSGTEVVASKQGRPRDATEEPTDEAGDFVDVVVVRTPLTVPAVPSAVSNRPQWSPLRPLTGTSREETVNYSERLDRLQQRVAAARAAVQDSARESREQLKQRIGQAQADMDRTMESARQQADQATDRARSKWAQMRADAAAKREDVKAKIDKRNREFDAKAAAKDADWAEADAADALDYADWAVDSAQLAILDAIDARAYADELAKGASSSTARGM